MRSVMLFFGGGPAEGEAVEGPEVELLREGTMVELCIDEAGEVRLEAGPEGAFMAAASDSPFRGSSGIVIDEDESVSIGDAELRVESEWWRLGSDALEAVGVKRLTTRRWSLSWGWPRHAKSRLGRDGQTKPLLRL